MMPAATAKACSIHSTGAFSSLGAKASLSIVLEAAMQVLRVNVNAVFVKDNPRNLRCLKKSASNAEPETIHFQETYIIIILCAV